MNYKNSWLVSLLMLAFGLMTVQLSAQAAPLKETLLVTYTTGDGEPTPQTYLWEATFGAFAEEVIFLPVDEVEEADVKKSESIVYIGEKRGELPKEFRDSLKKFEGKLVAFGYNAEQLPAFANWQFLEERKLRVLDGEALPTTLSVIESIPPKDGVRLSVGETLDDEIAFISQYKNTAYIAASTSNSAEKFAVSKNIYDILELTPPESHQAYIRLEDVTPQSNPDLLREAGDYLIEREIPFYISLNPLYENKEKEESLRLGDNEALVEVLQDLQNRGGMIIAHGYTKSYLPNEGEEGYEFWDRELNQKITNINPYNDRSPLSLKESFPSKQAYENYMAEVNAVEQVYIEGKLSKSVEELARLGLYPISFEPPNYAMSLSGYDVASKHFSSIFGHLQLSDQDASVTNVPLFVTSPAVTNRMKIYPETIGFVNVNLNNPLEEIEQSIRQLGEVPGSVLGGFYHSYLGAEYLPEFVELIESVGSVEWLDLRKSDEFVHTKRVEITARGEKTPFNVKQERVKWSHLFMELKNRPLEAALWGITGVVLLFLLAFFIYIARLRVQLRKRLFEEREANG